MSSLSIVMPAFNEASNLPPVMETIPRAELADEGWETEVLVVDNASTDGTGDVARSLGARVVPQPERGYGNAYHAGFAAAAGDVIATGDADCTYPFDALPGLLRLLVVADLEFLTTNRLTHRGGQGMQPVHRVGNHVLSVVSRALFHNGLHDSQSGMWVFRRSLWQLLDVRSTGMAFSQEIKNAATLSGCRCLEVPIEYRERGGEVKLHAFHDGMTNLRQLFAHRFRQVAAHPVPASADPAEDTAASKREGLGTA